MDQAREFVRNRDNGNLTEKFKLRNLKPNVNVDNDDTKKFNIIKKSRKKSKGIDEKIEYLEKECQKTGLNEIANSTSGIYSVLGKEENPAHTTFTDATCNGQPFAMTSTNGLSIGGAFTNSAGYSFAPDGTGPATSYQGISKGMVFSRPGYQKSPEHRRIGSFLWYWTGSSYARLEWKFDNQNVSNAGQWARWKQGAFTPFLDPILGDASFDPACLAAVLLAGGGGAFPDPDSITPPNNPVLFKNDLGDPSHLPIDINGLSPEAYNYLDTASSGYSDDTYNWYVKTYGAGAAGWYMNNPNSNPKNNPFLPGGAYVPFTDRASNPTDDKTEIALPPAAILAAMAALGIAIKGAETTWKLYRKYKQQIDQKVKEMQAAQGQTA